MEKKKKAKIVLLKLEKKYSVKKTALKYKNPFELLVATILSAQCTDVRVNIVTKKLFKKYKTVKDYASAKQTEFEKDIYSTGFYKNKAKNIIATANLILEKHNGRVPQTMEELILLHGVARKTANIVLSGAFGKNEGMAIDTHVKRLTFRIGLTKQKDPVKIEQEMLLLVPQKKWDIFSLALIEHGRQVCNARKPKCSQCILNKICDSAFKF